VVRTVPKLRRRTIFGRDPEGFNRSRLPYPPEVFAFLEQRCGLGPGAVVLEIGPGTGIATRELLRRGASPVTVVEPDPRLARYLRRNLRSKAVRIVVDTFEGVRLPPTSFDLVVAATSFHWLEPRPALRKVARLLRPGGWWVMWGNHHGDPYRASAFDDAIQPLYQRRSRSRPSLPPARRRKEQEVDRRAGRRTLAAVRSVGAYERIGRRNVHWTATLPTERVVGLWASFSDIATRPPAQREAFLSGLGRIAEEQFGGTVRLPVLTSIYSARRN